VRNEGGNLGGKTTGENSGGGETAVSRIANGVKLC